MTLRDTPPFDLRGGLSRDAVERFSAARGEPAWVLDLRLRALEAFLAAPPDDALDAILRETAAEPDDDPENEAPRGAAAMAQVESEALYRELRAEWARQGVVFLDMDAAVREREDLVRGVLGTIAAPEGDRAAALNGAIWSGGSFVYIPPGVRVEAPLQASFRASAAPAGQFERSLLVVGEGADVHYVEGCTAPARSRRSLYAAAVEVLVERGGRCRYTTLQNWSKNVVNLVAKRALAREGAAVCWVDANIGSGRSRKRPSVELAGVGARAEVLAVTLAGPGQVQEAGARVVHAAPATESAIASRAVAHGGGRATFREEIEVRAEARGARATSRCDALLFDRESACAGEPALDVRADDARIERAGAVSEVAPERLLYLASRGIEEDEARVMLASGFVEPIARELPMEYAVELSRLVQAELAGGAVRCG